MTRVYDNWERLVEATLNREKLRRLALAPSIDTAASTTADAAFFSPNSSPPKTSLPSIEGYSFEKSIQLAYTVIRAADEATSLKAECLDLKSDAQKLVGLLHEAASASNQLYHRPTQHILHHTEDVLDKAAAVVLKCHGLKRLFTSTNPTDFHKISTQLANSISNVSWLLRGDEYLLLPPIAYVEPLLYRIWEPIATLYAGPGGDEQCDATASLVYWARDDDLYKKLIVEEGGLRPLLILMEEGKLEAKKNAVEVIGLLGKDSGNIRHLIDAGVCSTLARILEEGPIELQPNVARALFELTSSGDILEHHFKPYDIVGLLVSHLKPETLHEHSKYDGRNLGEEREISTREYLMEMAAATLWHLVKVDSNTYHSITKSRTLLCFANLLEKGPKAAQHYCAMAIMEVTAAAEREAGLRIRSGFKLNSPGCKVILDQFYRIVNEAANPQLLVPCIKTIGNLATTTIRASETRMINPLVKLLEEQQEGVVSREACVALMKYAFPDNFLSVDRSKAIVAAGGVKRLVMLVYFGERIVQKSALVLLCYISLNLPRSVEIAEAEVPALLEWASMQPLVIHDEDAKKLLAEAKSTLERYQSRVYKEQH